MILPFRKQLPPRHLQFGSKCQCTSGSLWQMFYYVFVLPTHSFWLHNKTQMIRLLMLHLASATVWLKAKNSDADV